jgi:hypothetical protein
MTLHQRIAPGVLRRLLAAVAVALAAALSAAACDDTGAGTDTEDTDDRPGY